MNKEEIRQKMLVGGFSIINEYSDPANEFFPDHNHPGDQLLIVLEGSISVTMGGKTQILGVGDELFFPAQVIHSAKVGPSGCKYIVGENP